METPRAPNTSAVIMKATLLLLIGITLTMTSSWAADSAWKPLFNGSDLAGWETYLHKPHLSFDVPGLKRDTNGVYLEAIGVNKDPLKVFTVESVDGHPAVHISGQGFGVMQTVQHYTNIHMRLQVKWGEKRWPPRANVVRDSGLLYFCHGPHAYRGDAWPRSIEFQIQEHDMGDLYATGAAITVPAKRVFIAEGRTNFVYDPSGERIEFLQKRPISNRCIKREDAEKPRGEWNTLELICFNGDSIHVVNGKVVMRLYQAQRLDADSPAPLKSGALCLQTEGAEVFYRNIEVRSIEAIPAEFKE